MPNLHEIFSRKSTIVKQHKQFDQNYITQRGESQKITIQGVIPDSKNKNKPQTKSIFENCKIENYHQIKEWHYFCEAGNLDVGKVEDGQKNRKKIK